MPPQQEDDGMTTLSSAWGGVHSEAALSCQLWVPNSTNLNSIEKQDGWAGKCTTLADSKRMSQSWWWLCWTRGQMHCTVSTAGRKREVWFCGSVGRAQPDRWHWEGLLSTGELLHQTEQNPLQSGERVSGLCYNRGEENNWHLLSTYLIFSWLKMPQKTLEASCQSQGKQSGLISYRITAGVQAERCCRHPHVQTPLELELPLTPPYTLDKEK